MDKHLHLFGKRKIAFEEEDQQKKQKLQTTEILVEEKPIFGGLINNAATCYLNSILQLWFHLPCLRKLIFSIDTKEDLEQEIKQEMLEQKESLSIKKTNNRKISLSLQKLFLKLQNNQTTSTQDFRKSLGWSRENAFVHHDVHEFHRSLCDQIERETGENNISNLFGGKIRNTIHCTDIPYSSSSDEIFYEIQVEVDGNANIMESLDKLIIPEKLTGENKIYVNDYGFQEALKSSLFLQLPPILFLHLKRFAFNHSSLSTYKINSKFEYPNILDMSKYQREYISENTSDVFQLFGVFVHSGTISKGHYFVFIKKNGKWFKFDDEKVKEVSENQAIGENYGGSKSNKSAYMLIYLREKELSSLEKEIEETEKPNHLVLFLKSIQQKEDDEKKAKEELNRWFTIYYSTLEHTKKINREIGIIDSSCLLSIRVEKTSTLISLKKQMGWSPSSRIYLYLDRAENESYRACVLVSPQEENQNIFLYPLFIKHKYSFYVDETLSLLKEDIDNKDKNINNNNIITIPKTDSILLFLKYFDASVANGNDTNHHSSPVNFDTSFRISKSATINILLSQVCQLSSRFSGKALRFANRSIDKTQIMLFKETELAAGMRRIDKKPEEVISKILNNGDIIIMQSSIVMDVKFKYSTVVDYYKYLLQRVIVQFYNIDHNNSLCHDQLLSLKKVEKKTYFSLELQINYKYDDIAKQVAKKLKLVPEKIRFSLHNNKTNEAESPICAYLTDMPISDFLHLKNPKLKTNIIYYEILDFDIRRLSSNWEFKVHWRNKYMEITNTYSLIAPMKGSSVSYLIEELSQRVGKSSSDIRLLWIKENNRLIQIIDPKRPIVDLNHNRNRYTIVGEEIAEEEKEMNDEHSLRVTVVHFHKDILMYYLPSPFFLVVGKQNSLQEIWLKIQNKCKISGDIKSKLRLVPIRMNKPIWDCGIESKISNLEFESIGIDYSIWKKEQYEFLKGGKE